MRVHSTEESAFKYKPPCGGWGYAVGLRYCLRVSLKCNRWDCKKCRKELTKSWMEKINEDLRGAVLYVVSTKKRGRELSDQIRRSIMQPKKYFCAHLNDGAIVFSNARFKGGRAINRKKHLKEIRSLMRSGKVTGISRRQLPKEDGYIRPPRADPWSFGRITEDLKYEYNKCMTDYEIGLFLLNYYGTDKVCGLTKLGKELIRKIQTGEINEANAKLKHPRIFLFDANTCIGTYSK